MACKPILISWFLGCSKMLLEVSRKLSDSLLSTSAQIETQNCTEVCKQ
jgi:hypothetical protein